MIFDMITIQPFFLMGRSGKLFACYYHPTNAAPKKAILHIPAFAEEMNKSRRMVALQAREMAKQGYAVLVLDLFGTGDSEGDFAEATWTLWRQDLQIAYTWLQNQTGQPVTLWSLRLGALLAMDFIADSTFEFEQLLCWQPVFQGEIFVMQLLRLRIASTMMDRNVRQENTADLKQKLLDGAVLEIAGYRLHPELMKPIMGLSAYKIDLTSLHKMNMIEITTNSEVMSSPAFSKFATEQQNKGKLIDSQTILGSPFWSTQEIVEVPELLTVTLANLH